MSSIISIPIPNDRKFSSNTFSKINDLNYSANSTLTTTSTTATDKMDDFYIVLSPDSKRNKNNESSCCFSYNSTPATPSLSSVLLSKKGSIKSSYSHLYNLTLNCSSSTYTYSLNQNVSNINNANNNKNSLMKSCNSFNCCGTTADGPSVPSVCESFDSTFSMDNSMSEFGGYSASLRSGVSCSKNSFVNTLFENSNNSHPLMEDDDDLTYEEQNSNMISIDLFDNSNINNKNNNSIIGSNQSEISMDDCVSVSTSLSSSSINIQRLLHDHLVQDEKCKQTLLRPSKSQKFVSNLSKSFRFISSLASSSKRATIFDANNLLSFDARLTDDRLPVLENFEQIQQNASEEEEEKEKEYSFEEQKIEQDIPLITFDSITSPSQIQNKCITMTYHPNINSNRSREPRINSNFLRFYAHDYSIKSCGLLGVTDYEIDLFQEEEAKRYYQTDCQENGDDGFDLSSESSIDSTSNYYNNLSDEDKDEDDEDDEADEMTGYNHTREMISYKDRLKIGLLSREKLWSSVILPPRDDTIDDHSILRNKYIYINSDLCSKSKSCSSLTRMNGGVMPWVNCYNYNSRKNQTCLKPYGFLANQTQFTVKGWANQRWVGQTSN
ncbi:hypothetical protein B5S33_g660 [[Candida] boidinii]|nr:hypothetical protein B5S30_g53 [[Candida] boidinii]OWB82039.1 hypothetical protein B5S33_g660 [[Candida] boidinii]